jgi:hypothetical protein
MKSVLGASLLHRFAPCYTQITVGCTNCTLNVQIVHPIDKCDEKGETSWQSCFKGVSEWKKGAVHLSYIDPLLAIGKKDGGRPYIERKGLEKWWRKGWSELAGLFQRCF